MLFRVLIFVLLVAISLSGVYSEDDNIGEGLLADGEGLLADGEGYIGPYTADDEADYASISSSISSNGSSEESSDINSSGIVVDMVAIYAEECQENLNWDIGLFVDDFMDHFEDDKIDGFFSS